MASEEGWVGIADVATHLSVGKDSIPHFPYQPCKVCRNQ